MSYNKIKTDPDLGQKVHEYLVSVGVETPVIANGLSNTEKIDKIQNSFSQILGTLGLDLGDDSLINSPKRIAKMYINEIFWGLDYEAFPKATVVENKTDILVRVLFFYQAHLLSVCTCEQTFCLDKYFLFR